MVKAFMTEPGNTDMRNSYQIIFDNSIFIQFIIIQHITHVIADSLLGGGKKFVYLRLVNIIHVIAGYTATPFCNSFCRYV